MAHTTDLKNDALLRDVPEVDGYKILPPCVLYAQIGKGGMGVVYRGKHIHLNLDVGVKCLKEQLKASDANLVVRFEREAQLAARVTHPNLVRVFDVGQRYGIHYLVMEYVRGETARERVLRKGGLSAGEALTIVLGAARGLAAAHAEGIIHRDIKPDNILIATDGKVKLADLGLGRLGPGGELQGETSTLTLSGEAWGTPRYMPPEQWEGLGKVGKSGDVWAMGATLYFLIAGKDAYSGGTRVEVMKKVCLEPFPDLAAERPSLPKQVTALLRRATDRDPARRYQDASELVGDLEAAVSALGFKHKLVDPESGEGTTRCAMVSPPPPELLARVKLDFDSGRTAVLGDAERARGLAVTASAPVRTSSSWSRWAALALAVFLLGAGAGLAIAWRDWWEPRTDERVTGARERASPAPGAESAEAPSSPEQTALAVAAVPPDAPAPDARRAATPDPIPAAGAPPTPAPAASPSIDPAVRAQLLASVALDAPPASSSQRADAVAVRGSLKPEARGLEGFALRVNGAAMIPGPDGRFEGEVRGLGEGVQTISIVASDASGATHTLERTVTVDTRPPEIAVLAPGTPFATRDASVTCRVRVTDATSGVGRVLIAGEPAAGVPGEAGVYERTALVADGGTEVSVQASDVAGNESAAAIRVELDRAPPAIVVAFPEPGESFPPGPLTVRGTAADSSAIAAVTVNGMAAEVAGNAWGIELAVDASTSELRVEASDVLGNRAEPLVRPLRIDAPAQPARQGRAISGFTFVQANAQGFDEYSHDATGLSMVLVPGGEFLVGAPETDGSASSAEKPARRVKLSSFLIGKYEVSQSQWQRVLNANPALNKGPSLPVEMVSWDDCARFCEQVGLSIPTEAQWEVAARGGKSTPYATGETLSKDQANFGNNAGKTMPVNAYGPNGYGLHNFHGNVWEWCADLYDGEFYARPEALAKDPLCTAGVGIFGFSSSDRVIRGGSWANGVDACRFSARNDDSPALRTPYLGFRAAKTLVD